MGNRTAYKFGNVKVCDLSDVYGAVLKKNSACKYWVFIRVGTRTVKVNSQNFLTGRDLNLTSLTGYSRLSFQAVQMPYFTSKYGHDDALLKGLLERIAMTCLNYFYHVM